MSTTQGFLDPPRRACRSSGRDHTAIVLADTASRASQPLVWTVPCEPGRRHGACWVSPGASARFDHRPLAGEPLFARPHNHGHSRGILDIYLAPSIVVWVGRRSSGRDMCQHDSLASFAPTPDFPLLLWIDILPFKRSSRPSLFPPMPHDLLQGRYPNGRRLLERAPMLCARSHAARRMRSRETTRAACSVLGRQRSRGICSPMKCRRLGCFGPPRARALTRSARVAAR